MKPELTTTPAAPHKKNIHKLVGQRNVFKVEPKGTFTKKAMLYVDESGMHPLYLAAKNGNLDLVPDAILLDQEAMGRRVLPPNSAKPSEEACVLSLVSAQIKSIILNSARAVESLNRIPSAARLSVLRSDDVLLNEEEAELVRGTLVGTLLCDRDALLDRHTLDLALRSQRAEIAAQAASSPLCSDRQLMSALKNLTPNHGMHPTTKIVVAAAANNYAPAKVLEQAILSVYPEVRIAAVSNPNASLSVLKLALFDTESQVLRAALVNTRCTAEIWKTALDESITKGSSTYDYVVDAVNNTTAGQEFYSSYVGVKQDEEARQATNEDANAAPLPPDVKSRNEQPKIG